MKKVIALLIAVASFSTSFSQSRKIDEARRIINGETNTVSDRKVYRDYGDDDYNTGKRKNAYKKSSNPGKHLGWYKGKGNPHRTGAWKGKSKRK